MSRPFRYREPVVALLMGNPVHPPADWIHLQLRARFPRVGLATVYRTLRALVAEGVLCELNFGTSESRFGLLTAPEHYHFICERCRTILALPTRPRKALERAVEEGTGHRVLRHTVEFYGLCRECRGLPAPGDAPERSCEEDRQTGRGGAETHGTVGRKAKRQRSKRS